MHYHFLIDVGGRVIPGVFPINANDNCKDNNYASHTGGLNTNKIGVALCGMLGFQSPQKQGPRKISKIQIEKLFELNANLLLKESWAEATKENLLTHYEIGQMVLNGEIKRTTLNAQNIGKIDICFLPPYPEISADKVGDFIRAKTNWYIEKIKTASKR